MPSHSLHARWERVICGSSLEWLDRLIDSGPLPRRKRRSAKEIVERYTRGLLYGGWVNVEIGYKSHDSTRLNCAEFMELAERVYREAGKTGLCVLILHHYLDKLPKLLIGLQWKLYRRSMDKIDEFNVLKAVKLRLEIEASVLFVIRHWHRLAAQPSEMEVERIIWEVSERMPFGKLTRETRRRKRNVVLKVLVSCGDMSRYQNLLPVLERVEWEVRVKIEQWLRYIICDIISDNQRLLEWPGVAKIAEALECNIVTPAPHPT